MGDADFLDCSGRDGHNASFGMHNAYDARGDALKLKCLLSDWLG